MWNVSLIAGSEHNVHKMRILPMLCECQRLDRCVEHRDMDSSYVLWVMHEDRSHIVFLHKRWLNQMVYRGGLTEYCGLTFFQLLGQKTPEECCKMISRTLLGALKYKPNYIVIVSDEDNMDMPYASGFSMDTILDRALEEDCRALVEGPLRENNLFGRRLSELCGNLADNREFFKDPKSKKYMRVHSDQVFTA